MIASDLGSHPKHEAGWWMQLSWLALLPFSCGTPPTAKEHVDKGKTLLQVKLYVLIRCQPNM
jgi:hypothetical protein